MSPLNGEQSERNRIAETIKNQIEIRRNQVMIRVRSEDLDPGLDKINFSVLNEVMESRRFQFELCHKRIAFDPEVLLHPPQNRNILCYFVKVRLNVEIVPHDYTPQRYNVRTDQEIKTRIQLVKHKRPELSESEIQNYDKLMKSLTFQTNSIDLLGPFYTWIMVVPGRYFHTRYAKYDDGRYVKLPIKWLERHEESRYTYLRQNGFVSKFSRFNIFTYERRSYNVAYGRRSHGL